MLYHRLPSLWLSCGGDQSKGKRLVVQVSSRLDSLLYIHLKNAVEDAFSFIYETTTSGSGLGFWFYRCKHKLSLPGRCQQPRRDNYEQQEIQTPLALTVGV